jgi:1-deoxy-D-xylulose-5-phosphate reductoisomerase
MTARRLAILGVTGSIGQQALDVLRDEQSRGDLELVAVSAHSDQDGLTAAVAEFKVEHTSLGGNLTELIEASQPDIVLNAVVGFAGLEVTLAALERGIDVALANKESLVAAGALCLETARRTGARILPVDSEHSALMQCIGASALEEISSLVLTASGGPFFGKTSDELATVTPEQALQHPTWSMGAKITIDSATLMNKGLELIEACVLFGLSPEKVEVVVHRHSIVHAMSRHRDGSLLAHLGWPDMRVPIAYALRYPDRPFVDTKHLDLLEMPALEFYAPDEVTFRCLGLAREAIAAGGAMPLVMNAANEVAVGAFLGHRIGFLEIARTVEHAMEQYDGPSGLESLAEAESADRRTRQIAEESMVAPAGR